MGGLFLSNCRYMYLYLYTVVPNDGTLQFFRSHFKHLKDIDYHPSEKTRHWMPPTACRVLHSGAETAVHQALSVPAVTNQKQYGLCCDTFACCYSYTAEQLSFLGPLGATSSPCPLDDTETHRGYIIPAVYSSPSIESFQRRQYFRSGSFQNCTAALEN
jgi:hypothetical protein